MLYTAVSAMTQPTAGTPIARNSSSTLSARAGLMYLLTAQGGIRMFATCHLLPVESTDHQLPLDIILTHKHEERAMAKMEVKS